MKKIYFVRDAKAKNFSQGISDFERELKKKGYKEIKTIASYLMLRGISVDLLLSSCALRAQQTALSLAEGLSYTGEKLFLEELYHFSSEAVSSIMMAQEKSCDSILIVGHAPYITEFANQFSTEVIRKIPTAGVLALTFDIEEWSELEEAKGSIDFFVYPKQFKYYMPRSVRNILT